MSASPAELARLRVEVVFHDLDERQAQRIAAELIGRAHELANLPECECDVDVNIRRVAADAADAGPAGTL